MDVIISEVFYGLFSPRILFLAVMLVVIGLIVGWNCGAGGMIGWSVLTLLVAFVMSVVGGYIANLARIDGTGVLGSGVASSIIISLWAILLILYFGAMWAAWSGRQTANAELVAEADAAGADYFVAEFNRAAAHPMLGQGGWFLTRWSAMSKHEKTTWVETRLERLRTMEANSGGDGILAFGMDLPGALAAIDDAD